MVEFYPCVEIVRLEESEQGTFGVLKVNKQIFCVTLEPKDVLNKPNASSIPAQQYVCRKHKSSRFGNTYMVTNVPGRTGILFHPGNRVKDTEGCILLADRFGKLGKQRAVLNSGLTFRNFIEEMSPYERFHLTIHEVY